MRPRSLVVISAQVDDEARQAVASGHWPRKDFLQLIEALQADVIDYSLVERRQPWRFLGRFLGRHTTQTFAAFARRGRYDTIFTDGEHTGIPLALLLRFDRRSPRLVTIGHLLTTPMKRRVFRWLQPQRRLDTVVVHAERQRRHAYEQLGLARERVTLVPYQVDPLFWHLPAPPALEGAPLICSAGLEHRDYDTLVEAVRGLDAQVVVAASSHWSRHRDTSTEQVRPANLTVTALNYVELRGLYARARFVVVPLRETDNQAGVTTILEAMAMGKAVVVSATRGQRDVVRGRLCTAEGIRGRPEGGPAAFGVSGDLSEAETGIYVPVGDAAALRRVIEYLLAHPEEAEAMGAAGRRVIEQVMNVDAFTAQIVRIIQSPPSRPARTLGTDGARSRAATGAPAADAME